MTPSPLLPPPHPVPYPKEAYEVGVGQAGGVGGARAHSYLDAAKVLVHLVHVALELLRVAAIGCVDVDDATGRCPHGLGDRGGGSKDGSVKDGRRGRRGGGCGGRTRLHTM